MKILSVGPEFGHKLIDMDDFGSSQSFLDYDLVIWDPSQALGEYRADPASNTYRGCKNLNEDDSARLLRDIARRRKEMNEMLELGRSLVVFTPAPQICYADSGRREHSGTGRSRQTTKLVQDVDILSCLPLEDSSTFEASGTSIEFEGGEPFAPFWNINKRYLSYMAYFKESPGKPLFFIKGTNKVVGSYSNIRDGILLFIPSFLDYGLDLYDELTQDQEEEADNKFIDSLITLIEELKKGTGDFELPSWSTAYILPHEANKKSELRQLNEELNDILAKISEQKDSIAALEKNKVLFTGSGTALEVQTRKVFEELGFTVADGATGRDDLILKYGDRTAVVEVKGVSKSAAEKHAAQLEKWVSEYYASYETNPKGILVVNAFSNIPPKDRNEDTFPDQMLEYCENREHCLITSLQLLGLYLDCKEHPEKKIEMINRMFATNGIFKEYQNWADFLTLDSGEKAGLAG